MNYGFHNNNFGSLLVRVSCCLAIAFLAACSGRHPATDELSAIKTIRLLNDSEHRYYAAHGEYAELVALLPSDARLTVGEFVGKTPSGYQFAIVPSAAGYSLQASHGSDPTFTFRRFYSDQTSVIRFSIGSAVPTSQSPRIDGDVR
jgi:hypothetical protein